MHGKTIWHLYMYVCVARDPTHSFIHAKASALPLSYLHSPLSPFFLCCWNLNSGPTPWATPLPALFFFRHRVPQTIFPGWLWTVILLISASWIARITGVSHQHPAHYLHFIDEKLRFGCCYLFKITASGSYEWWNQNSNTSPLDLLPNHFTTRLQSYWVGGDISNKHTQ
jgi:hypothetical protein